MSKDQIKVLKIVYNMLLSVFSKCPGYCTGCKANVKEQKDCIIDMIINEIDKLIDE